MKHTKFFIFALVAAMTFSACGTDDTLQFYYPENGGNTGGGNTGGNTGGESTDKNNTNKNVATANMPQVVRNAIGGLEFPNGELQILQKTLLLQLKALTMVISALLLTVS